MPFGGKVGLGHEQFLVLILGLGFNALQSSLSALVAFFRLFKLLGKFKILLLEGPYRFLHLGTRESLNFGQLTVVVAILLGHEHLLSNLPTKQNHMLECDKI